MSAACRICTADDSRDGVVGDDFDEWSVLCSLGRNDIGSDGVSALSTSLPSLTALRQLM